MYMLWVISHRLSRFSAFSQRSKDLVEETKWVNIVNIQTGGVGIQSEHMAENLSYLGVLTTVHDRKLFINTLG